MNYSIIGSCKKCGAPIYCPSIWHGVIPPPPYYSCNCFNKANYVFTTTNNTQNPGVISPITKEAEEKLWEEFEDNDITIDTKPTADSLLRRLKKLEKLVEELSEKLEKSSKDKEQLETIKKILKG